MANGSASSPIKPHFLQPLLPGFHNHISIPISFYSKHIKGTTNEVVKLRSNGSDVTWEVKMDCRRLTHGWEKFATGHAFQVGDIVIFRHDGDLLFHVTPFGPSCCEIQYNDDDVDDGTSSSTLNLVLYWSLGRFCSYSHFKVETDTDCEKYHHQHTREAGSSSDDHSCFVARVTDSNIRKDALFLPLHFSRSNGFVNRECEIILLNEDEKPWTLFLKYHKTNGHVYIRRGWRSFCQANQKRVDDVLTFKLVKAGRKPVLQLRASVYNRASSSSSPTSQDRFVTLTLKKYHFKSCKLSLPVPFVMANGIKNVRKVILVDRYGGKRTTSLKPDDKYGRMRLGKGCIRFCEANGVKVDESFRLELIKENRENHLLKFCSKV
ncbi:hypothetical protein Bca52824_018618 [Brassica carinata]|uniref:TF-B3 domain-containing protein n=1 Tax=Brassica carinata TaxID=52824 RepID=A0A8X7VQ21_BRACI|nr:hypothetical protein Bca52824_018618 [Brassica carinata]